MNPTVGLQLSLSAIKAEFEQLGRELQGMEDCLGLGQSPVIAKLCLETIAKHGRYVAHVATAEAEKQARHLNRHAVE
jgi:hypothetical protein